MTTKIVWTCVHTYWRKNLKKKTIKGCNIVLQIVILLLMDTDTFLYSEIMRRIISISLGLLFGYKNESFFVTCLKELTILWWARSEDIVI